jgi:chromosome segregation ATPase
VDSATRKLAQKERELQTTSEALENTELQLRQTRAELDSKKQQLNSVIEDLRAENEQMRLTQTDTDTQLAELSTTIEGLRTENQQLRGSNAQNLHPARQAETLGLENEQLQNGNHHGDDIQEGGIQEPSEEAKTLRDKVLELKQANKVLKTELNQEREDKTSMAMTLQGVADMLQGVVSIGTRDQMVDPLRGVLSMIRGALNLGNRIAMGVSRVHGVKRGRSEDEDDDDLMIIPDPKRGRS